MCAPAGNGVLLHDGKDIQEEDKMDGGVCGTRAYGKWKQTCALGLDVEEAVEEQRDACQNQCALMRSCDERAEGHLPEKNAHSFIASSHAHSS